MFFCNHTDFLHRLNGSDFIVGKHNRNQNCFWTDGFLQFLQIYQTVFIYIQVGDSGALFFQIFAGMQNRMVLNFRSNDVIALA